MNTLENDQRFNIQTASSIGFEIPYTELKMNKEIGKGSGGVVYIGEWRQSRVAIKVLPYLNPEKEKEFISEADLMK